MKYSEAIKKYRMANKISMGKLAKELGVTRQAVGQWESGATVPKLEWLMENAPKSEFHRIVLEALYPAMMVR